MAEIVVIGTGYVGLTTGVCLAEIGNSVSCIDVDSSKIARLSKGECVIFEPGLEILLQRNIKEKRLKFDTNLRNVVDKAEIIFLCLPTPDRPDGSVDVSAIDSFIVEHRSSFPSNVVVVNKSTAPVGTAQRIANLLERDDVFVVSNPEFLREGSALEDFLKPSRVVIGSVSPDASAVVRALYEGLNCPILETDTRSAELIKYASNAFLATKIAFINSIATLCEALGADVRVVADAMGRDPRIGAEFLRPGPGYGGSCFPKDTLGLLKTASEASFDFEILQSVVQSNIRQTEHVIKRISEILGPSIADAVIGVWGLTFKANTDDLRHSPALAVVKGLETSGARILAYDPTVKKHPDALTSTRICDDALKVVSGADLLVVLTDWAEFHRISPVEVSDRMRCRRVFDTRNCLNANAWLESNFELFGTGIIF